MVTETKKYSMVALDKTSHDTLKELAGDVPIVRYLKRLIEQANKEANVK